MKQLISATIQFFKTSFKNTNTTGVRFVLFTCVLVYLIFFLVDLIFNYDLRFVFSAYPTYSENFHFYQIFTSLFVHSSNIIHILFNLIFLTIFIPFVEQKIGFKKLLFVIFFSGIIGFFFINYSYYLNKSIIEREIVSVGIDPNAIKLDNENHVDSAYLSSLKPNQIKSVENYNHVTSKTHGSSGFMFGIILMYLLYNWSNYKKIIPIFLGGYLIFQNIEELLLDEKITNGSVYAHFGGMLGGLICFIIFIIQEKKQKSKNRIRVDS